MDVCSLLVLLSLALGQARGWSVAEEATLQTTLLTGYATTVRPEQTVTLSLTVVPLSLNSLDIGRQVMSFSSIFLMNWNDHRLTWTPSSHGNIEDVVMQPELVWTPPLVVENAVSGVGKIGGRSNDDTPLRVSSSGDVLWFPPLETSTSCEMKITRFPFDRQTCAIAVTVWGVSTNELVLWPTHLNYTYYSPNAEWELLSDSSSNDTFYDGSRNHFHRLNVQFSFRRKWQFYGQNLLLPIVLLALLTGFVFLLPPQSGESLGFALTVLLSYVVFLTWVTDNLPPISNDVSLLQVYLAMVLCLGVLATLLTCWVIHVHHREPEEAMSAPMRVFVSNVLVPLRHCTCTLRAKVRANRVHQVEDCSFRSAHAAQLTALPSGGGKEKDEEKVRGGGPEAEMTQGKEKEEEDCSWPEVAAMFNRLFFVVYSVVVPLISSIMVALLYQEYY